MALALSEFMGRAVDDPMKKRAKEIQESLIGASALDAIKHGIRCALQACRKCNTEGLPVKMDLLDGRPPIGSGVGGAHDSARCAICRRRGYDCSL